MISLRPLAGLAALRRAARKHGASVFALPTLLTQALDASDTLRDVLRCDVVIVTSPAAAQHAHTLQYLPQKPAPAWFAVGAGTAAVLRRIGIDTVHTPPQGNDSSALLAHPLLQSVAGKRIGVITAPGGRNLIVPELIARGAKVVRADVYRRAPATISPRRWQQLQQLSAKSAIFVSSEEGLNNLWQAADAQAQERLLALPCITSSERLQAQALRLGWLTPQRAASALPVDMLAALAAHVARGSFR